MTLPAGVAAFTVDVGGHTIDGGGLAGFALVVVLAVLIGKMILEWVRRLVVKAAMRHGLYLAFSALGFSLRDLVPEKYGSVVGEVLAFLPF